MRALVTGGAGFIASTVVDRLLADGWSVTAIDNFDPYYDPSQKRRNVAGALKNAAYRLVEGDIRDTGLVDGLFADDRPDLVLHLAARPGIRASIAEPRLAVEVNEVGAVNVLEACRKAKARLVFASTSSVYGGSTRTPFREDDVAAEPLCPYAASKRGSELMAYSFHHLYDTPTAVLRFFTVYGPRGRPDMAVWSFTRAILAGNAIRLHGEETARDFTYVDDIVDGVVGAMRWVQDNDEFDTFNLGRGEPIRVRALIETLSDELGRPPVIDLATLDPGESPLTCASVDKARAAFGYRPRYSLRDGLRRWVDWFRNSDEAPPHR